MTRSTNPSNSGGLSTRTNDPDERLAYIALALIPGLGARSLAELLSRFGGAPQVLNASRNELLDITSGKLSIVTAILSPPIRAACTLLQRATSLGHHTLVPSDASYPHLLRSIPDPPVLLFAKGRLDAIDSPGVAIVGSRMHSRYGAEVAKRMAETAARAGIPVISGMARGLDAVAHSGALDAGGMTVGVLGTGLDVIYPRENALLFERMEIEGLLVTEHPPGDRGNRWAFPRRNRLISGLARALVVIEAAEGSGTLTTVSCALEQGREVLAVPGPIDSVTSNGTNRLLKDGATPLLSPSDLLAAFGVIAPRTDSSRPVPPRADLSPDEAKVLAVMSGTARSVDEIAFAARLPIGLVLGTLLGLELGGLAEQLPDSGYRRR